MITYQKVAIIGNSTNGIVNPFLGGGSVWGSIWDVVTLTSLLITHTLEHDLR